MSTKIQIDAYNTQMAKYNADQEGSRLLSEEFIPTIQTTENIKKIKESLTGRTKEMTIDKIKSALKSVSDEKYYNLINSLKLKNSKGGEVIATLGSKDITIKTSTLTEVNYKEITKLLAGKNGLNPEVGAIFAEKFKVNNTQENNQEKSLAYMAWYYKATKIKVNSQDTFNQMVAYIDKTPENTRSVTQYYIRQILKPFLQAKTDSTHKNYIKWAELAIVKFDGANNKITKIVFEKQNT